MTAPGGNGHGGNGPGGNGPGGSGPGGNGPGGNGPGGNGPGGNGPGEIQGARSPHFVSQEPFDPYSVEHLTPEQERYYLASQWQLMWWKLRHHRLAVISGVVLLFLYGSIAISEWSAP